MEQQHTTTPEQDMREVFNSMLSHIQQMRDKVISTVVSHSETARELAILRERFTELNDRMTSVVNEAQRFRQDLHATIAERDKYKRDADDHLALAQNYEKERDEARHDLHNTRVDLDRATHDLSQSQREVERLQTALNRVNDTVSWQSERITSLNDRLAERGRENGELQTKLKAAEDRLTKLQGVIKDIFPVTEEAKPTELPGTAPSFQPFAPMAPMAEEPTVEPHPVQSAGESHGVNERIDEPKSEDDPWWKKHTA